MLLQAAGDLLVVSMAPQLTAPVLSRLANKYYLVPLNNALQKAKHAWP